MKAISVKQPWAYLICSGIKDIENRTWKCPQKYIGQRVLIHASAAKMKGIEGDYLNDDQIGYLHCGKTPLIELHKYYGLRNRYSAIIGSVEIVDCVINHTSIWAEPSNEIYKDPKIYGDNKIDSAVWNWVLANPIHFDHPILNVKGKLRFWNSQYEEIVCPNCDRVQLAEVVEKLPWNSYIHNCPCGYTIMESEWNRY